MKQLKVIGKEKIGSIEFTGIEGGFGADKKAMLVKDIAAIHGQPQGEINRRINDNISRFKKDIDLIDLKSVKALNHNEYGFAQNAWNRLKNAYLLSERGYAKLLKILEDDTAWEIYDELVDNYFNMRQTIQNKLPQNPLEVLEVMFHALKDTNANVAELKSDMQEMKANKRISTEDYGTIGSRTSKIVNRICREQHLDQAAKSLLFQDINHSVKQMFDVPNRGHIKEKDFAKVLEFLDDWEPSTVTKTKIRQMDLFEEGDE